MEKFEYAGLRLRFIAFAFDYLIIAGYILVTVAIGLAVMVMMGPFSQASPMLMDLIAFFVVVLPVVLYFIWQESSPQQATWGKRKMGLRVTTPTGERLSLGRMTLRSLVKFLPWQLAHTTVFHLFGVESPLPWTTVGLVLVWMLVGIYLASLALTKTHRTPYDWLAGSVVVKNLT